MGTMKALSNWHRDEQDWSSGTYGVGCESTDAGALVPYEPENEDRIRQGHEHHEP